MAKPNSDGRMSRANRKPIIASGDLIPARASSQARFRGMPAAQQIEARHRRAHPPDRPALLPARPRGKRLAAQRFLALDDLLEAPFERIPGPQRLPDRGKAGQHRQRGEPGDRVVEADPGGQPGGNVQILRLQADHISKRAILFMMATPVTSIATATPSRI